METGPEEEEPEEDNPVITQALCNPLRWDMEEANREPDSDSNKVGLMFFTMH